MHFTTAEAMLMQDNAGPACLVENTATEGCMHRLYANRLFNMIANKQNSDDNNSTFYLLARLGERKPHLYGGK
jgi:hypothetical protein